MLRSVLLAILLAAPQSTAGQTPSDPPSAGELLLHKPVERDIKPGASDLFLVHAQAGQFLHVVVEQKSVDVALVLLDPAGKELASSDTPVGPIGFELSSAIAAETGTYRVQITAASESAGGRYRIELVTLRPPTAEDRLRLQAESYLNRAIADTRRRTRQSFSAAAEEFGEANKLWRQLNDGFEEWLGLTMIAGIDSALGNRQSAIEHYRQSLPIAHALGDLRSEAATLHTMAGIYADLDDARQAIEIYKQVLPLRRQAGDRRGEAITLHNMAATYADLGDTRQALDFYNQALLLRRAVGDRAGEALTLTSIGKVYSDIGEKQKALQSFLDALPIHRQTGDRSGEATALMGIGIVLDDTGEKRKALDYYNQALPIFQAEGDRPGEAAALTNIGLVDTALGDRQQALDRYNRAADIYRALHDRRGEALILSNAADVYAALGDKHKALDSFGAALAIRRAIGDRFGEAATLTGIGGVYAGLGENPAALDFLTQALPLHHAIGDRSGEASTLASLGSVYSNLGEKQKALDYLTQAFPIYREIGERSAVAGVLTNIGGIYFDLGDLPKALDYFTQALPLLQAVGDRTAEAVALNNLGSVYSNLGDDPKALDYYNQSLPFVRAVGDRAGEASTLNNIGVIYSGRGDKPQALAYFNQALPLRRAVIDRAGEARTLANIRDLFQQSQPALAITFGKQAVNVLQSLRRDNQGLRDELRHTFEKSIESQYRALADLLIGRGRLGEAEEVLNLLKDKEASDFLRDSIGDQLRSATLRDFEKAALDRYDQIVGQIVALGQRRAELLAKPSPESAESSRLDADLKAANLVLNRYFEEQEKEFAAQSNLNKRMVEIKDAEGLQESLQTLGPRVVAIYTLITPGKYTAMLVTSQARKAYTSTIQEADLNRKIERFRQLLQNPASDPLPLARELYTIVFPEGLRHDLDSIHAQTIMWSVDGTLRYIPFAALHDGTQYLVQSFQQALFTPDLLKHITDQPNPSWTGAGFGVSEGVNPLPSVPAELHAIFKDTPQSPAPIPGVVRLDAGFTRAAFESELRQKRPVVHIATHFDSEPGVAANSTLLLGDGKLTLAEIAAGTRFFEGVDLLTLSACNTAFKNGYQDGREVDSFGTIVQRQGAKAVIASLWSVNDPATAFLMETMYRLHQASPGMTKAEALRQAQAAMLNAPANPENSPVRGITPHRTENPAKSTSGWSHPYYWASFILLGNWR